MLDRHSPADPEDQCRLAARWFPAVPEKKSEMRQIAFPDVAELLLRR